MQQPNSSPTAPTVEYLGHPKGLYICFLTEMWERFSFYGMKALLFLYLIKYHLFTDENGYSLLGAYGALVYALPVIGGLLADRYLGMRKAVIFGASLLVLGHLGMAFEGHKAALIDGEVVRDESALQVFYFSLALICMGVGFLKPNISTIVGNLYAQEDPRRDSAFTIFYAGINVGAWLAPLICGFLGETYGWKYGFGLAGIGMFLGLLVFIFGQKHLQGKAECKDIAKLNQKKFSIKVEYWIYAAALVGVVLVWGLIQTHSLAIALFSGTEGFSPVVWFMHLTALIMLSGIAWFLIKHCSQVERDQMIALLSFVIAILLFFGLYEQTYGSWVAYSDRLMDRQMLGINWEASQLVSTGAFFIILLTPFFAWLWPWLANKGRNPSKPYKMAIGLAFAGLSFVVMAISTQLPNANGLVSAWYLVVAYFVLELGELSLSPIALSAVTQLSVQRVVGLMMGALFLGLAYANVIAAQLSSLTSLETLAGEVVDNTVALAKYQDAFWLSAQIGLAAAAVYLLMAPLLKRMMHADI
ncbi:peptide MFS transporter [Aliikangiella sp. IMCC44653]